MPCFHPLRAFQCASGDVVFYESSRFDVVRQLSLPCGQCVGCRLERSRQWAMRCMHEASLWRDNSFVTLTYSDDHLPVRGNLEYPAFQKFMKRLRFAASSNGVRFFMCGEYGDENWRPHYHACLFNVAFSDQKFWRKSPSGERLFRSDALEKLWPFGNVEIGRVTFESAAYVARYSLKKVTGKNAEWYYRRVDECGEYQLVAPFVHMSLKPGIGSGFLAKWKTDIYPHDYAIVNGVKCKPPKYYDRLLERSEPDVLEAIKEKRDRDARSRFEDNTDERLAVKELIVNQRVSQQFFRSL